MDFQPWPQLINLFFFFFLDFYSYQVRKIDFIKNLIRIRSQMMLYLTTEINPFVCDSLCMSFEPPTLLIYLFQFWWWPANSHLPRVTGTCLLANLFVAALKKLAASWLVGSAHKGQTLIGSLTGQETIWPQIYYWLFDWREERDLFLSLTPPHLLDNCKSSYSFIDLGNDRCFLIIYIDEH